MSKPNDLSGQKFARLLVVARAGSAGGRSLWSCVCDCGATLRVNGKRLVSGNTKSCGCLQKEKAGAAHFKDVAGSRFGRLVAQSRIGSDKDGRAVWRCLCDCGATSDVLGKSLRSGNTTSCGCYLIERNAESKVADLTGRVFGLLTVLRKSDEKRGKSRGVWWVCVCQCGGEKVCRGSSLSKGASVSCGCAVGLNLGLCSSKVRADAISAGAKRRARKRLAGGSFTPAQIKALFVKQRGCCANCGCKLTDKNLRRDHRKALANGGTNDIINIELLCDPCNSAKSAKDEIEWANENGRLL